MLLAILGPFHRPLAITLDASCSHVADFLAFFGLQDFRNLNLMRAEFDCGFDETGTLPSRRAMHGVALHALLVERTIHDIMIDWRCPFAAIVGPGAQKTALFHDRARAVLLLCARRSGRGKQQREHAAAHRKDRRVTHRRSP